MTTPETKTPFERVGDIVRIFQRRNRWYANFQVHGKQHRQSLKTDSKKEARRRAIQIEAEIIQGLYRRSPEPPLIAMAIDDYMTFLRTERRAPRTLSKYQKIFNRLAEFGQRMGARTVADVTLKLLDAFRSERVQSGIKPKTLFTESVVIRQLVNFALSRGLISTDPLKGLRLRKPKPTIQPCWISEEVELILCTARGTEQSKLTVLADTGMRVGELKYLDWSDVDFDMNTITIRPKDGWQPKTGDQRSIPMSVRVARLLSELSRKSRWVFTAAPSAKFPKGDHQFSERHLLVSLKRVLKKIGLSGKVHTFRHAFISHALTSGIPEAIVRQWVGHVDADVLKHYTHVGDTSSQAAMQRLDGGDSRSPQTASSKPMDQK